jgi:rfaE bifunctional protein nucleotidyltransferase chain/domain
MNDEKIITKEEFYTIRENLRQIGKAVVLCHGVFDLLHYGHIEHLQEAKQQGDILVVSVTAAKYVNKGPGRPYFNDQQRMSFLASLEIVDYVLLSEEVTVHAIVTCVRPDVYVKGQEYTVARNDITGNIGFEQKIVEQYGGRIYFTQGEVYSSTKLLNTFFDALPENVIKQSHALCKKYGMDLPTKIRQMVDRFSELKVLVIGDIIIDDYVFCKVQGVTSKDNVISTRYDFKERYAGGALAIARHLANFADKVTLLSMTGDEADIKEYMNAVMDKVNCELIRDSEFITPVKMRFLKRHPQRQEYDKLFSMNKLLDAKQIKNIDYQKFYSKLDEMVVDYDLVVVCDYGHGLLDNTSIEIIEKKAKFLAVNCQTNSSNYGLNIITKYHRADMFVVDERELRLAMGDSVSEVDSLLNKLIDTLKTKQGWVTVGADGAYGISGDEHAMLSAVTLHVKDTVGAGDAFYSLAALAAVSKLPVDIGTLISNIAGAIKTNLVGNSKPIEKVDVLKFMNTVLNV